MGLKSSAHGSLSREGIMGVVRNRLTAHRLGFEATQDNVGMSLSMHGVAVPW